MKQQFPCSRKWKQLSKRCGCGGCFSRAGALNTGRSRRIDGRQGNEVGLPVAVAAWAVASVPGYAARRHQAMRLVPLDNASGATKRCVWCHQAMRLVPPSNASGATKQRVWCHQATCLVPPSNASGGTRHLASPWMRRRNLLRAECALEIPRCTLNLPPAEGGGFAAKNLWESCK